MSNTNHPVDLSPEAQLARKFKAVVLPTITNSELRALNELGWEYSVNPAASGHSTHYFVNTLNVSDSPLLPGAVPTHTARVRHQSMKTALTALHPLDQMDPLSAQYAATKKFNDDLQQVRSEGEVNPTFAFRHPHENRGLTALRG